MWRLLCLGISLLLVGTACATRVELQSGADNASAPPGTDGNALDWTPCAFTSTIGAECAQFQVPVDYDDPDGDTLTLSVSRVSAAEDRIGALVVNPGGPGATASDFAISLSSILPKEITDRFDIIGLDPRGTHASAIDCGTDSSTLYRVDHSPDSADDQRALLDTSREYVEGCNREAGDLLSHLGTRNVVRDIDALRAAMGDEQISYLGYSYGTAIGQVYADMFPDRVRAMVLDGIVELGSDGTELARKQALGFERALASFAADCDGAGDCLLSPDAIDAIDDLIAQVEAAPIAASPRDLGPGELKLGLVLPLYSPSLWPDLEAAVDQGLDGDGSPMVALAEEYLSLANFDVYFAVSCLDFAWPDDPEQLLADAAQAADSAPHFGEAIVNDYVRCAMWPVEADPLPAVTAPGTAPILIVSTTSDPATPYEAAVSLAERLQSGVLLTYDGDGHAAVGQGVSCIDDAVVEYLVDLDPPENGTTCGG